MKDEFLSKIKSMLSGSAEKEITENNSEDLVNSFMNQILDAAWLEEDLKAMHSQSYHLSKKNKSYWLMNTTLKSLYNINGGVEIIPIEAGNPNTLCLIGQSTYSIPNKYIVCTGWN